MFTIISKDRKKRQVTVTWAKKNVTNGYTIIPFDKDLFQKKKNFAFYVYMYVYLFNMYVPIFYIDREIDRLVYIQIYRYTDIEIIQIYYKYMV